MMILTDEEGLIIDLCADCKKSYVEDKKVVGKDEND